MLSLIHIYINIVKNKGRRYIERDKKEECEIPEYSKAVSYTHLDVYKRQ